MLRTFLRSDFAQPQGVILGVEEELRVAIIPGCPDLLARVDLLIETKDALHVLDFKTARSAWNVTKTQSPVLTVHDVPIDTQQVERTKRNVERVWRAIQSQNFYPRPSPLQCPMCPYREPCRSWAG
jgi:CRISPR/Cas system-associated exonuclease Cas4 (RecB family)